MIAWPVAIAVVVLTVLLNGFFAGVETGFTSARRIRLLHRAREGSRLAALTTRLMRDREGVIVSAVVGNNVTIVTGTAVATAALAARYGASGESMAAVSMTLLNMVFGEILPKSLYRSRPEPLIMISSPAVLVLGWLLWPLRVSALLVSRGVVRLFGGGESSGDIGLSRERIVRMFKLSYRGAELAAEDDELVTRFVNSAHLPVRRVLTPLSETIALGTTDRVADAVDLVRAHGHSRLPVLDSEGQITGLILFRDLVDVDPQEPVEAHARSIVTLSADLGLDEAIAALLDARASLASVAGPDDRDMGILSLEDLLEPLVGDIDDEHDPGGQAKKRPR